MFVENFCQRILFIEVFFDQIYKFSSNISFYRVAKRRVVPDYISFSFMFLIIFWLLLRFFKFKFIIVAAFFIIFTYSSFIFEKLSSLLDRNKKPEGLGYTASPSSLYKPTDPFVTRSVSLLNRNNPTSSKDDWQKVVDTWMSSTKQQMNTRRF